MPAEVLVCELWGNDELWGFEAMGKYDVLAYTVFTLSMATNASQYSLPGKTSGRSKLKDSTLGWMLFATAMAILEFISCKGFRVSGSFLSGARAGTHGGTQKIMKNEHIFHAIGRNLPVP